MNKADIEYYEGALVLKIARMNLPKGKTWDDLGDRARNRRLDRAVDTLHALLDDPRSARRLANLTRAHFSPPPASGGWGIVDRRTGKLLPVSQRQCIPPGKTTPMCGYWLGWAWGGENSHVFLTADLAIAEAVVAVGRYDGPHGYHDFVEVDLDRVEDDDGVHATLDDLAVVWVGPVADGGAHSR